MFIVFTPSFQAPDLPKAKRIETQIQKNKQMEKQNKKSGAHFTPYFVHSIIKMKGKVQFDPVNLLHVVIKLLLLKPQVTSYIR